MFSYFQAATHIVADEPSQANLEYNFAMTQTQICLAKDSFSVTAERSLVWQKMLDWEHWTSWETGMEWVRFTGAISSGSAGKIKLKNGPVVDLAVTQFDPEKSYTSEFKLYGTTFVFTHNLENDIASKVLVEFSINASGLTSPIISKLLRSKFTEALHSSINNFKKNV